MQYPQQNQEKKVLGNYEYFTSDILGQGTFGVVYCAIDTITKERVAIKLIQRKLVDHSPYLIKCLCQEVEILKQLKSDYIVNLLGVNQSSNNYYIVQEFCDGGDLRSALRMRLIFQEDEAVNILKDLLIGFKELLFKGIIHRDLKPENILIKNNRYKLADFGFARHAEVFEGQVLTSVVGTPLYMSPQILKREKYVIKKHIHQFIFFCFKSSKSDIWSIGLIFYEMLYGKTPYYGSSMQHLLNNITNTSIQLTDPNKKISNESKDFIQKCLQFEECNRIDWINLYKHPLFKGNFYFILKDLQKSYKPGQEVGGEIIIDQCDNQNESPKEVKVKSNIFKKNKRINNEQQNTKEGSVKYTLEAIKNANMTFVKMGYSVIKNNIDFESMINNSQYITLQQFQQIANKLDKSIKQEEIECAFALVSLGQLKLIPREQFIESLNQHFEYNEVQIDDQIKSDNQKEAENESVKQQLIKETILNETITKQSQKIQDLENEILRLKKEQNQYKNDQQKPNKQEQEQYIVEKNLPQNNKNTNQNNQQNLMNPQQNNQNYQKQNWMNPQQNDQKNQQQNLMNPQQNNQKNQQQNLMNPQQNNQNINQNNELQNFENPQQQKQQKYPKMNVLTQGFPQQQY